MESVRVQDSHTSCWSIWNKSARFLVPQQWVWKSRTKCFPCCNLFILYILRFLHQISLCEKGFRILLRPIREAKRFFHVWENRFASLIGRSKIGNAFSHSKIWYENLSMYKIRDDYSLSINWYPTCTCGIIVKYIIDKYWRTVGLTSYWSNSI